MLQKILSLIKRLIGEEPKLATAEETKNLPKRKLCEDLLKELSAERFKHYNPPSGLSVTTATMYANIETYTKGIVEVTKLVKQDKVIRPTWIDIKHTILSVDRFLVSEDGYYVNAREAVDNFKKAGLELCAVMEQSDVATYGLYEHNLRMLTKLFINLRYTTIALIEVSIISDAL